MHRFWGSGLGYVSFFLGGGSPSDPLLDISQISLDFHFFFFFFKKRGLGSACWGAGACGLGARWAPLSRQPCPGSWVWPDQSTSQSGKPRCRRGHTGALARGWAPAGPEAPGTHWPRVQPPATALLRPRDWLAGGGGPFSPHGATAGTPGGSLSASSPGPAGVGLVTRRAGDMRARVFGDEQPSTHSRPRPSLPQRWVLGPSDGLSLDSFCVTGNRHVEISSPPLQVTKDPSPRTRGPGPALGSPGRCRGEPTRRKDAAGGFSGPGGADHRFHGAGRRRGRLGFGHEGQDIGKTGPTASPRSGLRQGPPGATGGFSDRVGRFVLPSLIGSPESP